MIFVTVYKLYYIIFNIYIFHIITYLNIEYTVLSFCHFAYHTTGQNENCLDFFYAAVLFNFSPEKQ